VFIYERMNERDGTCQTFATDHTGGMNAEAPLSAPMLTPYYESYYCSCSIFLRNVYSVLTSVKQMFDQAEQDVRLFLTMPRSNTKVGSSFSALRRLTTYLRNSMSDEGADHLTVFARAPRHRPTRQSKRLTDFT